MNYNEIRELTDNRWNFVRFFDSVKILCQKKGILKGSAYTVSLLSTSFLAGVISYFCAKGSVISLQEMEHEKRHLINLRAYGDAGGWLSICIFTMITGKNIFEGVIGEAEYLKCQSLLTKQIQMGQSLSDQTLNSILKTYASKCIFNKSVASQKLLLTEYTSDSRYEIISSELKRIDEKIQKQTSPQNYLKRVVKSGQAIFQTKKTMGLLVSAVMGLALPTFLLLFGVFSLIGEFGLGKELFVLLTSLDDTGHFGEWITNFFEALVAAYILHITYILNEGDYAITKEIYDEEIDLLQQDMESQSSEKLTHLLEVRKEELKTDHLHYKKFD